MDDNQKHNIENYFKRLEKTIASTDNTMRATLTSRRDHNFRVQTGKTNQKNKLITLYERIVSVDLRIYRAFFHTKV